MESTNTAVMNEQIMDAAAQLQALKTGAVTPPLPAHVQANLQRAFRMQHATHCGAAVLGAHNLGLSRAGWLKTFAAQLAPLLAVAVVMAGAIGIYSASQQNNDELNSWRSPKIGYLQAPFIALKDINLIALELNTTIVETQLSPMQLVRLGMPVNPNVTANVIPARVLVSDSGEALALKLDY